MSSGNFTIEKNKIKVVGILKAISTIFDLWGNNVKIKLPDDPIARDINALKSDWEIVGNDLQWTINKVKKDPYGKEKITK